MLTLAATLAQSVVTIFVTGPIKVWLDIKRGKTSLNDLQTDFQDDKSWLHSKLGVDNRGNLFPNRDAGPRRRQRENATRDEH